MTFLGLKPVLNLRPTLKLSLGTSTRTLLTQNFIFQLRKPSFCQKPNLREMTRALAFSMKIFVIDASIMAYVFLHDWKFIRYASKWIFSTKM